MVTDLETQHSVHSQNTNASYQPNEDSSRLSLRLPPILSSKIDVAVHKSQGRIRDRTEFGIRAIQTYLQYIETRQCQDSITQLGKAILTLWERLVLPDDSTYQKLLCVVYGKQFSPFVSHRHFRSLMRIRDSLPLLQQKRLDRRLLSAKKWELDQIYEEVLSQTQ